MTKEQFREKRHKLGWSQIKLAKELGISESAIVKMEAGDRPIEKRTILALRYLEMSQVYEQKTI